MILRAILITFVSLICINTALATGSLDFKAGDYYLNMTVSMETMTVIDPIYFASPETSSPIGLYKKQFHTFRYDFARKSLTAIFVNANDPSMPKSFTVNIRGKNGVLTIEGKRVPFSASWKLL